MDRKARQDRLKDIALISATLRADQAAQAVPDLTASILDRVDAERAFLAPSVRRRVLIARAGLVGAGVMLVLGVVLTHRYAGGVLGEVDSSARATTPVADVVASVQTRAQTQISEITSLSKAVAEADTQSTEQFLSAVVTVASLDRPGTAGPNGSSVSSGASVQSEPVVLGDASGMTLTLPGGSGGSALRASELRVDQRGLVQQMALSRTEGAQRVGSSGGLASALEARFANVGQQRTLGGSDGMPGMQIMPVRLSPGLAAPMVFLSDRPIGTAIGIQTQSSVRTRAAGTLLGDHDAMDVALPR